MIFPLICSHSLWQEWDPGERGDRCHCRGGGIPPFTSRPNCPPFEVLQLLISYPPRHYLKISLVFTTNQAMFVELENEKFRSPNSPDCLWLTLRHRRTFFLLFSYAPRHFRFRRIHTIARFMTAHRCLISLWIQNCLHLDLYIIAISLLTPLY